MYSHVYGADVFGMESAMVCLFLIWLVILPLL